MNPSRITRFTLVCLIAALSVGLSACDEFLSVLSTGNLPEMEEMPGEITLGLVVPLTGPAAGPYGFSMKNGFEMARAEINAQGNIPPISFITEDDMSTVEGAVAAFQSLVTHDVPAIVGLVFSSQAKEAFPIAQENRIVAFSPVSTAAGLSGIGDYIFRAALATNVLNPNGVKATLAKLGYRKVAMIYDAADIYSTRNNELLAEALAEFGVEALTTQTFQTHDTDVTAQLMAIMESDPEAVLISALTAEKTLVMSQGREVGIPSSVSYIVPDLTRRIYPHLATQQLASSVASIIPDLTAAEGAITFINWFNASDTPGNQEFVANYKGLFGTDADQWAAQSYATLYILAAAIEKAQSADSAAIRDALAQTADFDTILGKFSFDPNGEAQYDPVLLVAQGGQLVIFEDVEMSSDDKMAGDDMSDGGVSDELASNDTSGGGDASN